MKFIGQEERKPQLPKFNEIEQIQVKLSESLNLIHSSIEDTLQLRNSGSVVTLPIEVEQCPQNNLDERYSKILHCDRIKTIYLHQVLQVSKRQIVNDVNINYSSVQNIIKSYNIYGRTNRKQYLDIQYLQKPEENSKKPRGRKRLQFQPNELQDVFGENKCPLKLYIDQDSEFENKRKSKQNMKVFTKPEQYPYPLGVQLKELEIVSFDVCQDDEGNNSTNVFCGPFSHINQIEQCQREFKDKKSVMVPRFPCLQIEGIKSLNGPGIFDKKNGQNP